MTTYYLDIETTGIDETRDKIITIQYQELERYTGMPVGDLTIIKEWEMEESQMLQKFIIDSPIVDTNSFNFIPVGYNLLFEHKFLSAKSTKYNKSHINLVSRPVIDLKHVGVLMNRGEFRGASLDEMTNKEHGGNMIPEWYKTGQYDKIEEYIVKEAKEFCTWYQWLLHKMPQMHDEFLKKA